MKKAILVLPLAAIVLFGAGCVGDPRLPQAERIGETRRGFLYRLHDDEKKVTCYIVTGEHGMACLPDKDL